MATQQEVNSVIDHLVSEAAKFEFARDTSEWESTAYWKHHDSAMDLILTAEKLMPQRNPLRLNIRGW